MTIQAQLSESPTTPARDRAERPTLALKAHRPEVLDALSRLDHRTRNRTVSQSVAPPGRYLAVEHGGSEHLIPLSRPITHIGRGLAADIRIEDPRISRRHAILAQRGDGVRVLDDRSSHGTFVNGREVEVASLYDGDVLRVGPAVLRYIEIRPAVKSPPLRRIPVGLLVRRRQPLGGAA
jgi:FHA domain